MKKMLFLLLGMLILISLLAGPISASETGSPNIPQVTPYNHPTLGLGLFFPEEAARINDALTETAVKKAELYEKRFNDIYLLFEASEAQLAVANKSLDEIPYLIDKAVNQGYSQGMRDGAIGVGFFGGYDFVDREACFGVGITYRVWTWNRKR